MLLEMIETKNQNPATPPHDNSTNTIRQRLKHGSRGDHPSRSRRYAGRSRISNNNEIGIASRIFDILTQTRLQQRTLTGRQLYHRLAVLREFSLPSPTDVAKSTTADRQSEPAHSSPLSPYNNCTWPTHMRRWNARWLGVNDIFMGIVAGIFLYSYSKDVLEFLKEGQKLTEDVLHSVIGWLMGWPAGFKLNENLDKFLGLLFLYYIDKWTVVTRELLNYFGNTIIWVISLSGMFGISVLISMLLDLGAFLTAHITCFYYISARFHHLELVVLSSLWKLFRGLKYNPLKKRIDSFYYEFDQLLLGTILLTLLVFLFPTTAVYYIFFTSLMLILISAQGLGGLVLELLNYFPLYHLVIYFTHSELLPSGIRFAVDSSRRSNSLDGNANDPPNHIH